MALGLAGCSSLDSVNPVNWWHDLEGGPIADSRPPPPNADAPYPALGDAPTKVPPNDAAARGQVADALVADRANAQYVASLAPLAAPPPEPAKPGLPKQPTAASADASNATLPAATSTPPAGRPAPPTPVRTADLPPPAPSSAAAAEPPADLPAVPETPPAPPALAGVPATITPNLPPATPPPKPPAPAPLVVGAPLSVAFASGSSALPSEALPGLKLLVRNRRGGNIAVTGFGEAASATPEAQQAAMPLAMARVRAVAAYLLAEGVPSSALRIDGEAQGRGAVVRPIN